MADGAARLNTVVSLLDDVVVLHGGICNRGMRSDGRGEAQFALSRVDFRRLTPQSTRI